MIEAYDPCSGGLDWYMKYGSDDLLDTLLKVNGHRPSWARWLFTKIMTRNEVIEIAIFSAEQVLHIFEAKYPNDTRPRKTIDAAKVVLKNNTDESRNADAYAAYAADAADAAAYVVYAANDAAAAAYAAAYAAYAAAYAAYAAYAADAADAAANAVAYAADYAADAAGAKKELEELIIRQAVIILDRRVCGECED